MGSAAFEPHDLEVCSQAPEAQVSGAFSIRTER